MLDELLLLDGARSAAAEELELAAGLMSGAVQEALWTG